MTTTPTPRTATVERRTAETGIRCEIALEGPSATTISTGLPFLDHLLSNLPKHGRIPLQLHVEGDLHIDDHHTAEDSALVVGEAIDRALGDRSGIERFGTAYAPLDEALARCVVDLSGRPFASVQLGLERPMLGTLACENIEHWLRSFAVACRATIHVEMLAGDNDHHRAEAAFKAFALALRDAVRITRGDGAVPSTKEVL